MLHKQADDSDAHPAAGTQKQRLSAAFYQLDEITVSADGSHCHDNKEFAQFLKRLKYRRRHTEGGADRSDHRCTDKPKDTHGKGILQTEVTLSVPLFFCLQQR